MSLPPYAPPYPANTIGSTSFHSALLPQPSSSYPDTSIPPPSAQTPPSSYPSTPPIDYPPILSSSPTLPSSTASPSLQLTAFSYPTLTPPSSISSSFHSISPPNPEAVGQHTPSHPDASFAPSLTPSMCQSGLRDELSMHSLLTPPTPLAANEDHSSQLQRSAAYTDPDLLSAYPSPAQPLAVQNQPQSLASHLPSSFPHSVANHGAPSSLAFRPSPVQNPSFANVSDSPAHSVLPNPNPAQIAPPFPPPSFPHLPHPPPAALQPNQSSSPSPLYSAPPAEIGAFSQFNPGAPFLSEMVLHHPSHLPQMDPSLSSRLPSPAAPPALYPPFPSYPLHLRQNPRSSFPIPLRHLYRQRQYGHAHPQGSYLDMSGRSVF